MSDRSPEVDSESLVDEILGNRMGRIESYPGLRESVIDGFASRSAGVAKRVQQQLRQIRAAQTDRVPDAYFADEEAMEDELQAASAGIRSVLALNGMVGDPVEIEQGIAHDLAPTGIWSLRDEASRVPRPGVRAAAVQWSMDPVPWLDIDDAEWPPSEAAALVGVRSLTDSETGSLSVQEDPYAGWVQIALFERMRTLATNRPKKPRRQLLIVTGLEFDGGASSSDFPLSSSPPDLWESDYRELESRLNSAHAQRLLASARGPIAGLTETDQLRVATQAGPGLHPFLLSPRIEVVALLGLRPESPAVPYVLVDDDGPAIICRQWTSFLIHDGSYGDLVPAIHGSDLILRGDLFEKVTGAAGHNKLSLGILVDHSRDDGHDD